MFFFGPSGRPVCVRPILAWPRDLRGDNLKLLLRLLRTVAAMSDHWRVWVISISFLPITGRDSAVAGLADLAQKTALQKLLSNSKLNKAGPAQDRPVILADPKTLNTSLVLTANLSCRLRRLSFGFPIGEPFIYHGLLHRLYHWPGHSPGREKGEKLVYPVSYTCLANIYCPLNS